MLPLSTGENFCRTIGSGGGGGSSYLVKRSYQRCGLCYYVPRIACRGGGGYPLPTPPPPPPPPPPPLPPASQKIKGRRKPVFPPPRVYQNKSEAKAAALGQFLGGQKKRRRRCNHALQFLGGQKKRRRRCNHALGRICTPGLLTPSDISRKTRSSCTRVKSGETSLSRLVTPILNLPVHDIQFEKTSGTDMRAITVACSQPLLNRAPFVTPCLIGSTSDQSEKRGFTTRIQAGRNRHAACTLASASPCRARVVQHFYIIPSRMSLTFGRILLKPQGCDPRLLYYSSDTFVLY